MSRCAHLFHACFQPSRASVWRSLSLPALSPPLTSPRCRRKKSNNRPNRHRHLTLVPSSIPSTLPGGTSALSEQHGTGRSRVRWPDGQALCLLQGLVASQSGQRLLSLELTLAGGQLQGILLTPFNLRLDQDVTLTDLRRPASRGGCVGRHGWLDCRERPAARPCRGYTECEGFCWNRSEAF